MSTPVAGTRRAAAATAATDGEAASKRGRVQDGGGGSAPASAMEISAASTAVVAAGGDKASFPPAGLKSNGVLGIRREDKNRWERRAPLAPSHVAELVKRGIRVVVQPSTLRIFSDYEYQQAGAEVNEDLSEASTIAAIKEVPPHLLLPNRTYLFFSHTIKAQRGNMTMLDTILERNIRLIDYEKITDGSGQRLVRFGKFAGFAGMIDMLRALGERLLAMHFSTPFLEVAYSHMYPRLDAAKAAVRAVGERIRTAGLPESLTPMVFTFTGATGQSASGALEIFRLLPHVECSVAELPSLFKRARPGLRGSADPVLAAELRHKLVLVCVSSGDAVVRADDPEGKQPFDRAHYMAHPELYQSVFAQRIAPYTSVIANCTYWDQRFPRFLTTAQMRDLYKQGRNRLLGVVDISCDVNGSLEFLKHTSSIDRPTYIYDIESGATSDSIDAFAEGSGAKRHRGVLFLAVDNLPTELPYEASLYFGDSLLPFLERVVSHSDGTKPYTAQADDLPPELYRAILACHGALVPAFEYITALRDANERGLRRVLLLGSGAVTPPLLGFLARDSRNRITVASDQLEQARQLIAGTESAVATQLDVTNDDALRALIERHDLAISLVPAQFHARIARLCVQARRHLVTASYISPEMRALDAEARAAGVMLLNEVGLDPGLDHMAAMQLIDEVKEAGGRVTSFVSVCGGLPAPEAANNPLGYKFSWSPRGALLAGLRPAKFRRDGVVHEVEGGGVMHAASVIEIDPCFSMEVLPNRDSLSYAEAYGLHDCATMFRGTLRYKGFARVMGALVDLGLLALDERPELDPVATTVDISWPAFLRSLLGLPRGAADADGQQLRAAILAKANLVAAAGDGDAATRHTENARKVLQALEWLGLLDATNMVPPRRTPLDSLCATLEERLCYGARERDMVLLTHVVDIEWPAGRCEKRTVTLLSYGAQDGTAMAKTVGVPTAIAAQRILDGAVKPGVHAPFTKDIYEPILAVLRNEDIQFIESSVWSDKTGAKV